MTGVIPPAVTEPIIGLATLIGAILVIWRFLVPAIQRARVRRERQVRANDVLLGTPAIPDPDRPGQFLREEIPDMGKRMTSVEDKLDAIAIATLRADIEQARKAADHAAGAVRTVEKKVDHLRAASEVWHADEIGVLEGIEKRITPTRRSTDPEGDAP